MYIRTPRALVWVEPTSESKQTVPKSAPAEHSPYREYWAKKSLSTARGRCIAVRQGFQKIELGLVVDNRMIWVIPQGVLSETQLENWLRDCF